ncbi:sensor histidine kinase [Microbacterium suwonense]|uniref:histidine kinase n=1 Tax=Microbacterium suwonense TaxID=683047 RepID=A0ABN6X3P5_9MICO|nr:histidine kinase [Microbacterium suwonense]BDZ39385.1 two-component sensor histidine kinase [Microbacterium suwonense]
MIRPISRVWLVLDIVGAILGLLITLPLSLIVTASSTTGSWIADPRWALVHHAVVAVVLWGAAAIARLSPPIALAVAWVGAAVQLAGGMWPSPVNVAVFAVLFATAAWGSRRLLWIGGASAVAGGVIAGLYVALIDRDMLIDDSSYAMRVLAFGSLVAAVVILSLAMSWGAGLLWRLVLHGRMTREAQQQAEAVAAEEAERVRIARDMHDIVAHSLAVVIAQADGARYAAAAQPEIAQEAMTTIAQTARSALSDVRMLLTQLRHRQGDGPQPTLADLETLFTHVRQAGIEPRVTVDPMPPGEPPGSIQLAVYRILQEALTNALRHGEGDVDVRLSWWPDRVDLEVRNRISSPPAGAGGGHGLVGMRERAQLVGGTLQAQRDAGWFTVRATMPIGAGPLGPGSLGSEPLGSGPA